MPTSTSRWRPPARTGSRRTSGASSRAWRPRRAARSGAAAVAPPGPPPRAGVKNVRRTAAMTRDADQLTAEFRTRLRAFVRRRVRSDADADDLVQDVLTKLVGKGEGVPSGSIHAWLFTVARRAIIDRFRTTRELAEFSDDLVPDRAAGDDGAVASELARCL